MSIAYPERGVRPWDDDLEAFLAQSIDPETGLLIPEKVEAAYIAAGGPSATEWYAFMVSRTIRYKEPVATASSLPSVGNTDGDLRIAQDTGNWHVWADGSWTDLGTPMRGPQGDPGPVGPAGGLTEVVANTLYAAKAATESHVASTSNPHAVTKTQVGLSLVPNVDARARSSHTGTQTASTISDLTTRIQTDAKKGRVFHVDLYGADPTGVADSTTAFTNAIADAKAVGGTVFFEGTYKITGTLSVTDATMVGLGIVGGGKGTTLIQQAANTPMFTFNGSDHHSWTIGNFTATWAGTTTTAHTAANLIHLGVGSSNKSFYNCLIQSVVLSNAYRLIDTGGMLFWGNRLIDINMSNMKGGVWSLNGSAGQPMNTIFGMYLNASQCSTTLFSSNALVATFVGLEINQNTGGWTIFADSGGGMYTFIGELSVEGGTYATTRRLFEFPTCLVDFDVLKLDGEVISGATATVFRTEGSGRIRVHGTLHLGLVPKATAGGTAMTGTGFVCMASVGGTLSNPNAYSDYHVDVNDVQFFNGLTGWIRTGPYVMPTDMGGAASADSVRIRSWNDPSRVAYCGDTNYTFTLGGPRTVIFTTATATRTATLPHSDFMLSDQAYVVVNNTAQTININDNGGSLALAVPTSVVRHAVYNRSKTGGPSLGWSKGT